MTSLNDILWGDQLGNPDDGESGDGTGIMPQTMNINCLAMCCSLGQNCNIPDNPPTHCAAGFRGCR